MELGSGRNKNLAPVQAYESTINNYTGSVSKLRLSKWTTLIWQFQERSQQFLVHNSTSAFNTAFAIKWGWSYLKAQMDHSWVFGNLDLDSLPE